MTKPTVSIENESQTTSTPKTIELLLLNICAVNQQLPHVLIGFVITDVYILYKLQRDKGKLTSLANC